jgi:DNA-binding beta-propeller fold protein YncE
LRLEDEPRHALSVEVTGAESWVDGRSIEHRPARERRSRIAAIILAFALSVASLAGLWLGFRAGPVDRGGGEATRAEPVNLQPRVSAVVPVGPYPADVAVGEGGVWVTVPAQRPEQDNLVVRIDPVTSEVMARIPVEGYVEAIAAGEGGVWGGGVGFDGGEFSPFVVRIDPTTNEVVARIPDVSGPLAVGGGALWAVDRAGARAGPEGSTLLRIDPATNQVVARIPLGVAVWDVEFGEGYVWMLPWEPDPGEGDIVQVDPATNEVAARIEVPLPDTGYPPTVFAPALGEGTAWVPVCCPDNELMLARVDVDTGTIVGEPITVQGGAPFAVAAGHVWFIEERGALYGLNVTTLEVDEAVSGFDWPAGGFPHPSTELDPSQLAVWVVNADQDSVTRIDLAAPSVEAESLLETAGTSLLLPAGWDGRADPLPGYTHRILETAESGRADSDRRGEPGRGLPTRGRVDTSPALRRNEPLGATRGISHLRSTRVIVSS